MNQALSLLKEHLYGSRSMNCILQYHSLIVHLIQYPTIRYPKSAICYPLLVPQTLHRIRQRRLEGLIAHRQQRYEKGRQARY